MIVDAYCLLVSLFFNRKNVLNFFLQGEFLYLFLAMYLSSRVNHNYNKILKFDWLSPAMI